MALPEGTNAVMYAKKGKAFNDIIKKQSEGFDLVTILPRRVLGSPYNRAINIAYCHGGIGKSFQEDGYDPTRPKPPCVIRIASAERKELVVAHNKSSASTAPHLWPKIDEVEAEFELVGGNHFMTTLRCYESGSMVNPSTNIVYNADEDLEAGEGVLIGTCRVDSY